MNKNVYFTHHAKRRMAQRNVSESQVSFILKHGVTAHCAGAILVNLRKKDIPKVLRADDHFAHLEGTTVVISREAPVILTIWRNRSKGLQHIRHKPPYSC